MIFIARQAELKTSEGLIATAVIYQSDKLFPSPTTTKVKISGSNEEKKEVFKDIATKFSSIENEADAEQVLRLSNKIDCGILVIVDQETNFFFDDIYQDLSFDDLNYFPSIFNLSGLLFCGNNDIRHQYYQQDIPGLD